jgi:serine kinase of HPr protein (carbohydrate metabolism regulator)
VIDVHATTVELAGAGVLLRGASGSGKSDLALRLVDGGARLVADDRTLLRREGDALIASAPPTIAGRLEVRGIGILTVPSVASCPLRLVVDLVASGAVERLPEPRYARFLGLDLPLISLAPFEASAVAKLRLAARTLAG